MKDHNVDRAELKGTLRRIGATQNDICAAISASKATVSLWFKGEVSSPALDRAIPAYIAGLKRGLEVERVA